MALLAVAGCAKAPSSPSHDTAAYAFADQSRRALDARKDDLLRQLATCESGEGEEPIVGGRGAYIGRFQFAPRTVITYVKEMDGRELTYKEAVALAQDYYKAAALAKYVIFQRDGLAAWPACSRKLGLHQQVKAIKAEEGSV